MSAGMRTAPVKDEGRHLQKHTLEDLSTTAQDGPELAAVRGVSA